MFLFSLFFLNRYCIPNGVEDTTNDRVLRLNLNAHPLSYMNDQDMGTSWISKIMSTQELDEGVAITLDLANGQYQVLSPIRLTIYSYFSDFPPSYCHDNLDTIIHYNFILDTLTGQLCLVYGDRTHDDVFHQLAVST